jgi:hypothetical protein
VRPRWTLLIVLSLFFGCHGGVGVQRAEVLSTPFPGTLVSLDPAVGTCIEAGCPFEYSVRITNPTDRDASVQACMLQALRLRIPVLPIPAGVGIPPHTTTTAGGHFFLPIPKDHAEGLVGRDVTCTGLDWHGNAPI